MSTFNWWLPEYMDKMYSGKLAEICNYRKRSVKKYRLFKVVRNGNEITLRGTSMRLNELEEVTRETSKLKSLADKADLQKEHK